MTHAHVRVSQLRFAWPDGTPVFEDLSFTLGAQRTGLVAPNGAGKSTLMRLLAGELAPTTGHVEVAGTLAYLPQQLALSRALRVAEVLGVAGRLDALAAIASGRTDQALFDTVGDDWDLEDRTRATLARLGLDHVALDRRLESLSGGEVMAVGLAAQWLERPDVLLLDEPSNHLDRDARQRLYRMVDEWDGCLVVASHDRGLLDRMDQIAELDRSALRLYGGGFEFYEEATRVEAEAAEQEVRGLRQTVKREQRERQQARERMERRAGNAARNLHSAGLARIVAGNRKRAAQVSAGRSDDVHSARIVDAQQRLIEARRGLRDTPELKLELPATEVPASRLLFSGRSLQVVRDGRALFGAHGVDLQIRGPERIALHGANGAGKTTLLQLIAGELSPCAGSVQRGPGRIAMLSQRLDALDANDTVAGNFARCTPELPDAERGHLLARWLFRADDMHLPVSALSGGERLRASLACVLHATPAPQLLVLDEPTNNLDLDAVRELESALRAYRGALVVVSHDDAFVDHLSPTRRLMLQNGRLRDTT
ncbi:ABC-F family ATP-binding cassette domain-containing protein [Lysobacter sp.]|uniref:ABC-F family ATP-binding cassette domain-containing protein n=1 Tax=Lysobacter sp. TaxID=72226 RepID=UPI002D6AD570|nr:ABC-F family ATP-binding cassette domain-containing protein [Lysobacter sp.]HZX76868.1 ABC-F family ATP-binding cassette domain-containing protein [Lysobacter sp.]